MHLSGQNQAYLWVLFGSKYRDFEYPGCFDHLGRGVHHLLEAVDGIAEAFLLPRSQAEVKS